MRALLILAFTAAVSARPGFYYAVSDPAVAAPVTTYAVAPTVAHPPLVYAHAAHVYVAPSGCRNVDGAVVPCVGETIVPIAAKQQEEAPTDPAPETAGVVSVKRREAEPVYVQVAAPAYHLPTVYTAPIPQMTYRACQNEQGSIVPCAAYDLVAPAIATVAVPKVEAAPAAAPAAVEETAAIVDV